MKVTVEQAVQKARNNESLKGLVIEDLRDTQVRAVDALALAEQGIFIPEEHIYYSDNDTVYDPDFDDMEWSKEPLQMSWEDKIALAKTFNKGEDAKSEYIAVNLKIPRQEIHRWVLSHQDKVETMLSILIEDAYNQEKNTDNQTFNSDELLPLPKELTSTAKSAPIPRKKKNPIAD